MPTFDLTELKNWFLKEKRDFPWRKNLNPYGVWVSEVMLQQTQADVVVPYFERWMKRYPNVKALAESSSEEVIKYWEGLGYYSRARNLHSGAKHIVSFFNGQLPDTPSDLMRIKGLGPYTVNALLSFAFHKKAFPLDGNAIRVLTRYFACGEDTAKASTLYKLREMGEALLPKEEHWIISEAFIELGATICRKTPDCGRCPLKQNCQAYLQGTTQMFPIKSKKVSTTFLKRAVAVLFHQQKVLIRKASEGEIMAGLHEFPYFTIESESELELFKARIEQTYSVRIQLSAPLKKQNHSFTRYRAELFPVLFHVTHFEPPQSHYWYSKEQLQAAAFSSGHRRILSTIEHLLF
ncbi:putative A/G-specific adenine glycosylase YfhQ [Chlamydiales bacterium STE3]|nr:putative A/G-specific adenine glycosylase YfhQ [Chlamydiales bacterium STE3]